MHFLRGHFQEHILTTKNRNALKILCTECKLKENELQFQLKLFVILQKQLHLIKELYFIWIASFIFYLYVLLPQILRLYKVYWCVVDLTGHIVFYYR